MSLACPSIFVAEAEDYGKNDHERHLSVFHIIYFSFIILMIIIRRLFYGERYFTELLKFNRKLWISERDREREREKETEREIERERECEREREREREIEREK